MGTATGPGRAEVAQPRMRGLELYRGRDRVHRTAGSSAPHAARQSMHESSLRTVLLIQAIEDSDRDGEVIPLADRADATRTALRHEPEARQAMRSGALERSVERFLTRRAERLLEHVELRSPVVSHVLALSGGASWIGAALLALALVSGISLSALDGSRRINILAFPLLGLVVWNLSVYAALGIAWIRRRSRASSGAPPLSRLYGRWIDWRARALLERASQSNAPLAAGLRRFASEWSTIALPLLAARARRLLHLSAACAALGLVAGLYVRGIVLQYEAGWESTFLGPPQVQALLAVLYGPASALARIALPATPDDVAALRWTGDSGGGDAATWIHLIAVTAALYIIVPRLLLALLATLRLRALSRAPELPPSLVPYARGILLGAGGTGGDIASITPYAYDPGPESLRGAEALLGAALGGTVRLDVRAPIRYGEEDELIDRLSRGVARVSDWNVLLMSLASTPEPENHGAVIAGVRDWLARSQRAVPLLVLIDESPYAARMRGETSFEQRLAERRRVWSDFVAGYGLRACIFDLAHLAADDTRVRDSVRAALWTPGQRVAV